MGKEPELPYHVSSKQRGCAEITRLNDGRFHIYRDGRFARIMGGFGFILVGPEFGEYLNRIFGHTLELIPAGFDEEHIPKYLEIKNVAEITPTTFRGVDSSGRRIWRYTEYLFVSPEVMRLIKKEDYDDLSFSSGFKGFAGGMSSKEAARRTEVLKGLAEFHTAREPLLNELQTFGWDWTEEPLLVIRPGHVISALNRFLSGSVSAAQLEEWACIFEVREDVGFETKELKTLIFRIANPILEGAITAESIQKMKTEIGNAG